VSNSVSGAGDQLFVRLSSQNLIV